MLVLIDNSLKIAYCGMQNSAKQLLCDSVPELDPDIFSHEKCVLLPPHDANRIAYVFQGVFC